MKLIKNRKSVRDFQDRDVSEKLIETLIEVANNAPSACNLQLWKFIIVKDQKIKNRLVDLGGAIFIKNAPVGTLVLYDNQTKNIEYADHIQSASAAIQNMLLMAEQLSLGACWICQLPPKKQLRDLFGIPSNYDPVAYIALGYPKRWPKKHPRKNEIKNIISYDRFNFPHEKKQNLYKFQRVAMKIYFEWPLWLKKMTRPIIESQFIKKFDN